MDLGDELFGPHVEEGELHAFANRAGAQLAAPVLAVADDQHHLAISARFDQAHKPHRHIVTVIGHEEAAALVEQMGEDGELNPADDLLNEAGNVAGIAQVAGDVLVLQPVHEIERVGPSDLGAQRYERLSHLHHIWLQE